MIPSRLDEERRARAETAAREASLRWTLLWDELSARPGDFSVTTERVEKLYVKVWQNGHLVASGYGEDYVKVLTEVLDQLGVKL